MCAPDRGVGGGAGPAPARARIIGIDDSVTALEYARRNAEGSALELVHADATAAGLLSELDGQVDLVVANPPYVPDGAILEPK